MCLGAGWVQGPGLTAGAPSISSMMRQLGLSSEPSTDLIWVAASIRVLNTSGLRSSLPGDTGTGHLRHGDTARVSPGTVSPPEQHHP